MRGEGSTQTENDSVRPRGVIEEVAQFAEEARMKAWRQWSECGPLGSYIGEGSSSTPHTPLTSLVPIYEEGLR